MAIFHSVRFCARSRSIVRDLKLLPTIWYFRGLPSHCCPSTFTLKCLHYFTTLSSLDTYPYMANHLDLPLLIQFLLLSRFKRFLSSEGGFLPFNVTLHIHLIILISLRSNLNMSASFTAQVLLPYSLTLLAHARYT